MFSSQKMVSMRGDGCINQLGCDHDFTVYIYVYIYVYQEHGVHYKCIQFLFVSCTLIKFGRGHKAGCGGVPAIPAMWEA
jgi:hypothetical protein